MFEFDQNQPIAIVGMGCYFPGANSYEEYWKNILENKCFIENLPDESEVSKNYNSDAKAWNRSSTKLCARIKPFDFPFRKFKGLMPNSINLGDFYSQYSLLAAQDAIEDSGLEAFNGIKDETFVAVGHYNYETKAVRQFSDSALRVFINDLKLTPTFSACTEIEQAKIIEDLENNFFKINQGVPHETIVSSMGPAVASRITKLNHFNGGFTSVDSACASSLAALDIAIRRLRDHSSRAAVVGGIGVVSPYFYLHCSKAHTMSTQGSFPFDKRASGFVVGEGAGFVVIKTLTEALKNGDRIHGVIRGVAGSSDGSKRGPWAPNKEGQILAVQRALTQAGYAFSEVDYVECHGTGTQVGDKEELAALNLLLDDSKENRKIYIGSAKGSVGHLLPGAGMAGLIRTIMALKTHMLPPTAGAESPIDELCSDDSKFSLLSKAKNWESISPNKPRRAMVNSFGFGGTNYNLQVEEFVDSFHRQYLSSNSSIFTKKNRRAESVDNLSKNNYNSPIAIVGIGLSVPGATNTESFHQNNKSGTSFFSKVPENRYSKKFFDGFRSIAGEKAADALGGYVDLPSPESKLNWKISPTEIKDIDPNQFRLLEVVKQSLVDSEIINKKNILEKTAMVCGVMIDSDFFGTEHVSVRLNALLDYIREDLKYVPQEKRNNLADEFFNSVKGDLYEQAKDSAIAGIDSMLGSRAAKFFDLKGGSISLDAVCATGIVAIDHACRLLRSGDLDAVVVCSSTMGMNAQLKQCYDQMTGGWLNEPSKPFDKDRRGFLIGEGAVCFTLRRLDDAIRDEQKIYSLIRATGISSDGSSNQMLQPNYSTAKLSFLSAQKQAGKILPVEMVECHGIGTISSDQTEMELVRDIYSSVSNIPVGIGALKGAIGHLKVCSAFATIARASLSVQTNTKYPTANFSNPDKFLDENKKNIRILSSPEEYKNSERFCAVTSFGLGGINGHLILSNYDSNIHRVSEENPNVEQNNKIQKSQATIVAGNAEERGILLGSIWAKSFNQNYEHVWQRLPSQLFQQKDDLVDIFLKWLPEEYKIELNGLAKGADVPYEIVLWANCLTMAVTTQYGLCFGFAKNNLHGSNYDFPFVTKNDNSLLPRSVFEFRSPGKIPFSGVFLLGSPFPYCGVNASGISVSASSGTALGRVSDGIFVYALVRMALENCQNLEEAKTLMKGYKISGSWIFIIQSKSEEKSIQVEMSESNFELIESLSVSAANHFQLQSDGLKIREDSIFRLQRLQNLIASSEMKNPSDGLSILGDRYDVSRKKVTKFSTSNTLNRYNSAVSFLCDHGNEEFYVSYKNIPSGEGTYESFNIPKLKSASPEYAKPIVSSDILTSKTTLGDRTEWREKWQNSTESQLYFLISRKQNDLAQELSSRFPNISIIEIENENINLTDSRPVSLIDLTHADTSIKMNVVLDDFKLKQFLLRKVGEQRPIVNITNIGYDSSVVSNDSDPVIVCAGNAISKPFYRALLKEKFFENFWQLDLIRKTDMWVCLNHLVNEQHPKRDDCLYFNNQLYNKRYSLELDGNTDDIQMFQNDVILFTGGASGIGFECLKKLVQEYPESKFIILGRTDPNLKELAKEINKTEFLVSLSKTRPGLTPKEYLAEWDKTQQASYVRKNLAILKGTNKNIFYYSCNLLDEADLSKTIAAVIKAHGAIYHVVHSAGLEKSKLFKDSADFLGHVFSVKTVATINLFQLLKEQPIRNIILFSSIAGELGNEGQSEYSAANGFYSFLSIELLKNFPKASVKNILWPGWDRVGMASKESIKSVLLKKGFKLIDPNEGAHVFFEIFKNIKSSSAIVLSHKEERIIHHDFSFENKHKLYSYNKKLNTALIDCISVALEDLFLFEKIFNGTEPFLKEHIIKDQMAIPGVFWIEMLMESTRYFGWNKNKSLKIDQIEFIELCAVRPNQSRKVNLIVEKIGHDSYKFKICSNKTNSRGELLSVGTTHATGLVRTIDNIDDVKAIPQITNSHNGQVLYSNLNKSFHGHVGPSFQLIKKYQLTEDSIILLLETGECSRWGFIFDTINQAVSLWGIKDGRFDYLPHQMSDVSINIDLKLPQKCIVVLLKEQRQNDTIRFQAKILDEGTGKTIACFDYVTHKQFGLKNINKEISI